MQNSTEGELIDAYIEDQEIEHSPYYQGYFAYWDGIPYKDIENSQKNGYLNAEYEVMYNNKNF